MFTAYDLLTANFGESSEDRFEKLNDLSRAVSVIEHKALEFQLNNNLEIEIVVQSEHLSLPQKAIFDYRESFSDAIDRMSSGEPVILAVVKQNSQVIGYGVALNNKNRTEIEVIDVDIQFRRSNKFCELVVIDGEEFSVGVAHLIVLKFLSSCSYPFQVDSTHSSSRYIFKSLGFKHDDAASNPCILIKLK
jgi:hypothetical protein